MDPWAVLGVQPGASKAEIKKAFRLKAKAHHPDMHTTASEGAKAAHDAAFRTLNEAYQQLMDGSARVRQRPGAAAYSRAGYYGAAAGQRAGGGYSGAYNPFDSYYGAGTGSSYSGWKQYQRRGGLDFRAAFRAFSGITRAEAAATAALGLLLAGGVLLLEDASQALWAANNQGKLFDEIQEDVQRRKQQKEEAAAAAAALRAASAAAAQHAAAAAAGQQREAEPAAAAAPLPVAPATLPVVGNANNNASGGGGSRGGGAQGAGELLTALPVPAISSAVEGAAGSSGGVMASPAPSPRPAQPAAAS